MKKTSRKKVEKKKKEPEPAKKPVSEEAAAQVETETVIAATSKKSKRAQKQEMKQEKSVSDVSGLKKKKKNKKSKKAESEKECKKQKTVFVQPGEKPQYQMNMFPMGQFPPLGLGMPMAPPMFNPAMMQQLLQMNNFKKMGAGSKPPSVGGLNLFKNMLPIVS